MGWKLFGLDMSPRGLVSPLRSVLKGLGLIPEMPGIQQPPTPPNQDEAASAAEKARKERRQRYGRQSTILTTPLGVTEEQSTQRKSLLGS